MLYYGAGIYFVIDQVDYSAESGGYRRESVTNLVDREASAELMLVQDEFSGQGQSIIDGGECSIPLVLERIVVPQSLPSLFASDTSGQLAEITSPGLSPDKPLAQPFVPDAVSTDITVPVPIPVASESSSYVMYNNFLVGIGSGAETGIPVEDTDTNNITFSELSGSPAQVNGDLSDLEAFLVPDFPERFLPERFISPEFPRDEEELGEITTPPSGQIPPVVPVPPTDGDESGDPASDDFNEQFKFQETQTQITITAIGGKLANFVDGNGNTGFGAGQIDRLGSVLDIVVDDSGVVGGFSFDSISFIPPVGEDVVGSYQLSRGTASLLIRVFEDGSELIFNQAGVLSDLNTGDILQISFTYLPVDNNGNPPVDASGFPQFSTQTLYILGVSDKPPRDGNESGRRDDNYRFSEVDEVVTISAEFGKLANFADGIGGFGHTAGVVTELGSADTVVVRGVEGFIFDSIQLLPSTGEDNVGVYQLIRDGASLFVSVSSNGSELILNLEGALTDLDKRDTLKISFQYLTATNGGVSPVDEDGNPKFSMQTLFIDGVGGNIAPVIDPPPVFTFIEGNPPKVIPIEEGKLSTATDEDNPRVDLFISAVGAGFFAETNVIDFDVRFAGFTIVLVDGDFTGDDQVLYEITTDNNMNPATVSFTSQGAEIISDEFGVFEPLEKGEFIKVSINYTVSDGEAENSTTDTFQTIIFKGVDNQPPVDGNEKQFIYEDKLNEFYLDKLENATDPDTPKDQLFLSAVVDPVIVSKPFDFDLEVSDAIGDISNGFVQYEFTTSMGVATLNLTDKGIETFDDPDGAFLGLTKGENVKIVIDYTVSDGEGGTDDSFEKLIIVGKNDPLHDGDEMVMVSKTEVDGFWFNKLENANRPPEELEIISVDNPESSDPTTFAIRLDSYDFTDHEAVFIVKNLATYKTAEFVLDFKTGEEIFYDSDDIFWSLSRGESVTFTIGYDVADQNGATDHSIQEIIIKGASPIALGETSNIVLYLGNDFGCDYLEVKKIKFEDSDLLQFELVEDLLDWVTDKEFALDGYTDLIAFSFKQGNNFEQNFGMAGGEDQLVTLKDDIRECPDQCTDIERLNDDVVFLGDLAGTSLEGGAFLTDNQYIDGGMF